MCVGKTSSMHFIMKSTVQDIIPELRGLIYQHCNTALHNKKTSRSVGKCHQNTIILSAFPSIIFLKIKKLLKDWVKLDMCKYLLTGIYSIIWCSWVWNFEDNSLSFYLLLCYGILLCQQGVFNVYQHFVCLPEIRKVGENPGKEYITVFVEQQSTTEAKHK